MSVDKCSSLYLAESLSGKGSKGYNHRVPLRFRLRGVHLHGKYDRCKAQVFVTLYCYQYWHGIPWLTLRQIEALAGVKHQYLLDRLPVFAKVRPYPLTGKFWSKRYILLSSRVIGCRAVMLYRLSASGKHWIEDTLSREDFYKIVEELGLG